MSLKNTHRHALTGLLVLGAALATALACQVPVFRYALERWEPDAYQVVVIGSESLTPAQQEVVAFLKKAPLDPEAPANIRVSTPAPKEGAPAISEKPRLELYYPRALREFLPGAFWTGDITLANANAILHSPARTQLARNILKGHSATWVFVESGHKEKDDTAAKSLAKFANDAKGSLRIPDGVIGASEVTDITTLAPSEAENVLTSDVPLKIDFSVLRLSRNDPAEEILLAMLLGVEDDLGDFKDEPMAFAAFGRGRVLQPLIGRGITAENVMFDSSYLCGACSCQVKEENPGIDLLLAAPWDSALEGSSVIVDKILPPLEGTAALTQAAASGPLGKKPEAAPAEEPAPPEAPAAAAQAEPPESTPLSRVAIILAVVFAGVVLFTLKLRNKAS